MKRNTRANNTIVFSAGLASFLYKQKQLQI